MRTNRSGFTVIETLIIVVLIAVLGFTGWYVYHSRNVSNSTKKTSGTPVPTKTISGVHDVKYFYDTAPHPPKQVEIPGGAYTKKAVIRGELIATKSVAECVVAPCPQPDPPQYTYVLQDQSDKSYTISIRGVDNEVVKGLKADKVYIISGVLEFGFGHKTQDATIWAPYFVFNPEKVE